MDLTITLLDCEIESLMTERLTPDETLESVIHRQLLPIVERTISQKFSDLNVFYAGLATLDKVSVLADLETLRETRVKKA